MNILILGAAGQIGRLLTTELLKQTPHRLVLFARNAHSRLSMLKSERVKIIDGDFSDTQRLTEAMKGIDVVYLNDMGNDKATGTIIKVMKEAGAKHIIGATVLGIYNEVPGKFGEWNYKMIGHLPRMQSQIRSAKAVENSGLDYTLLRISWLYDKPENKKYILTQKGEPFRGTQVTRTAVAQLIVDIIGAKDNRFIQKSLGVSEPGTEWDKPSFY